MIIGTEKFILRDDEFDYRGNLNWTIYTPNGRFIDRFSSLEDVEKHYLISEETSKIGTGEITTTVVFRKELPVEIPSRFEGQNAPKVINYDNIMLLKNNITRMIFAAKDSYARVKSENYAPFASVHKEQGHYKIVHICLSQDNWNLLAQFLAFDPEDVNRVNWNCMANSDNPEYTYILRPSVKDEINGIMVILCHPYIPDSGIELFSCFEQKAMNSGGLQNSDFERIGFKYLNWDNSWSKAYIWNHPLTTAT